VVAGWIVDSICKGCTYKLNPEVMGKYTTTVYRRIRVTWRTVHYLIQRT
jgi:hypothetical protein